MSVNKVVVYHGTTVKNARQILKEQQIQTSSRTIKRYDSTTNGYVYVTKILCDALDFSTRPILGEDTSTFVVFKIEVLPSELEYDNDEAIERSTLSKDGYKHCFKISRNLILGEDVVAYYCKKTPTPEYAGAFMQSIEDGRKNITEEQWIKIK